MGILGSRFLQGFYRATPEKLPPLALLHGPVYPISLLFRMKVYSLLFHLITHLFIIQSPFLQLLVVYTPRCCNVTPR